MGVGMTSVCPHCGAENLLGVWFPHVKAYIVGCAIGRRRPLGLKRFALKAHVWQINNMLAETDWCLRSEGHGSGCYRVVRRQQDS
jgi:hypothetical protein